MQTRQTCAYFTSALTAKQAIIALDHCLAILSPSPSPFHAKLFTDRGSEMGSQLFQNALAERQIDHYVSHAGSKHHSGQIERVIRMYLLIIEGIFTLDYYIPLFLNISK